ncbi:MAG: diguanylate cyclase domain-containing protein [Janthinobacterium lividum]
MNSAWVRLPGVLHYPLRIRTCAQEGKLHQARKRLHGSVLEDAVTGFGNRACLRQHLNRLLSLGNSVRTAQPMVAVFSLDLDRFKAIHDGLEHDVGDEVLVEVAGRIGIACAGDAVACRLGERRVRRCFGR